MLKSITAKDGAIMASKIKNENNDFLFKAILQLKTLDECYDFFEDFCGRN